MTDIVAVYWKDHDPPEGDRLFQRAFAMEESLGVAPDPMLYDAFYLSRLQRAKGRAEALALLYDWRADLRDSTPTDAIVAAFALYGDTQSALQLKSRTVPSSVPMGQFSAVFSDSVVASAQGRFDEAEQHLASLASLMRDHAVPRGEARCLVGFAKVTLDRGDYPRASRLLAAVSSSAAPGDTPFRSATDALIYVHCSGVLRQVLDPEIARTTQAEGAALSVKEALDAELAGGALMVNPAK